MLVWPLKLVPRGLSVGLSTGQSQRFAIDHKISQTQTLDDKEGCRGQAGRGRDSLGGFFADRSKGSVAEEKADILGFYLSNEGNDEEEEDDDDDEFDEREGGDEGKGATASMKLDGSIVDDGPWSPWAR